MTAGRDDNGQLVIGRLNSFHAILLSHYETYVIFCL